MSTPMTFLLCEQMEHAADTDTWIMEHLRDRDGAHGSSWSGVYTDGTRYGVLWAAPASELFGDPVSPETPDGDPSVQLVVETFTDGESDWGRLEEPEAESTP